MLKEILKISVFTLSEVDDGISPDERVDFGDVDVVQLLDGAFDLMFVGLDVNNEHKCVVVFYFFHSRLCC